MSENGSCPLIYIIVLHFNNPGDTILCVESCRKLLNVNFRILVVDNSETEGYSFPRDHTVEVLRAGNNLGYAGGMNKGISRALGKGADYIWLLNSDTVVDSRCLDYMVRTATEDDRIGMVGGKICYLDNPDTIWFAGGTVDLASGGLTGHIGKDQKDGAFDTPGETQYITGCSILAKRQMIEEVGLLDEKYFLYFEDVDWSLRAREKGWKLVYEPKARIWHKEGAQSNKIYSPRFVYYSLRNRLYFMKRFAPHHMLRCHALQLKMGLFFVKSAFGHGISSFHRTASIALYSYIDFYIFRRMGKSQRV